MLNLRGLTRYWSECAIFMANKFVSSIPASGFLALLWVCECLGVVDNRYNGIWTKVLRIWFYDTCIPF